MIDKSGNAIDYRIFHPHPQEVYDRVARLVRKMAEDPDAVLAALGISATTPPDDGPCAT